MSVREIQMYKYLHSEVKDGGRRVVEEETYREKRRRK